MLSQLTLKDSRQIPSLLGALLHARLLKTASVCASVMGVSRKSLHPSSKFLSTAFSIRVKLTLSTWKESHLLRRNSRYFAERPRVRLCYTFLLSMLVIISVTCRFRIFRRCKIVHFQDFLEQNVASFVSVVVDWSRLLCSRKILALRWFSVVVFSLGILRNFKMLHIEEKKKLFIIYSRAQETLLGWTGNGFSFRNISPTTLQCPDNFLRAVSTISTLMNRTSLGVSSKFSRSFYIGPSLVVADRLPRGVAHMPLGDL